MVIAMEGAVTEPTYFEAFWPPRESEVQIKLVNNPGHKSHPKEVLQRLKTCFTKSYDLKRDQGWMVIDRDAWPEQELREACTDAGKAGFRVALSNPCFELWLYLHLRNMRAFSGRHDCQNKLAGILPGYQPDKKGGYEEEALRKGVHDAVRRAELLDTTPNEPVPPEYATRVYCLMRELLPYIALPVD
ncbi:MAG TPA: RloB family protein [Kiritimatiellia bacterium]|nr:RloB family protein [Kiritimatiellia bacterium]HMP33350.1 RloB family protein [Kiritimatiellia bacterium]